MDFDNGAFVDEPGHGGDSKRDCVIVVDHDKVFAGNIRIDDTGSPDSSRTVTEAGFDFVIELPWDIAALEWRGQGPGRRLG